MSQILNLIPISLIITLHLALSSWEVLWASTVAWWSLHSWLQVLLARLVTLILPLRNGTQLNSTDHWQLLKFFYTCCNKQIVTLSPQGFTALLALLSTAWCPVLPVVTTPDPASQRYGCFLLYPIRKVLGNSLISVWYIKAMDLKSRYILSVPVNF